MDNNLDAFRRALCLRNDFGWCGPFDAALVKAVQFGEQVNWVGVINDMATEYAEQAKNRTLDKFWDKADKIHRP